MLIITTEHIGNERSAIWIKGLNTYTKERTLNKPVDVYSIFSDFHKKYDKRLKYEWL